jgi:hypothetical protein
VPDALQRVGSDAHGRLTAFSKCRFEIAPIATDGSRNWGPGLRDFQMTPADMLLIAALAATREAGRAALEARIEAAKKGRETSGRPPLDRSMSGL